jgi:1-acyl-sn-glycerol-3-phosphate acyltransferase
MKFSLKRQSTGKVYPYISQFALLMLFSFFRKIYLNRLKLVPTDAPVILAGNHPTAFVDPILLCLFLDPPIYNMTRGDIFKKPLFRKMMESINMFPVYRVRDGYAGRDRNDEVFDYCIEKLREERVVTIYVEGEHHLEKIVRPAKKGFARIAFGAFERYAQDNLQIIPAGSNYQWGDRPRDVAMVNVGPPIFVKDYWPLYQENQGKAINALCADLETALKKVCFSLETPEDGPLLEQLLELHRGDHLETALPIVQYNTKRFELEKEVCNRLNDMTLEEKQTLKTKTDHYFGALTSAGVTDLGLKTPKRGAWWAIGLFLLGLIPFLVGYLSSLPLMRLTHWSTGRLVKKREFVSSVMMGIGFIAGTLYYLILLIAGICTLQAFWIGLGLSLPILGWFSMFYREMWAGWRAARKAISHPKRLELLALREKIEI